MFLNYKNTKKILIFVIIAIFVFPFAFSPKKVLAIATETEVAAIRVRITAAEIALRTAQSAEATTAAVLQTANTVTPPTSPFVVYDATQDILTRAANEHQLAKDAVDTARLELEAARTELAQAMAEKDTVWDAVARGIARIAINQLTNSLVNWIRTGYDVKPSFVTNPKEFLGDIANQATGVFIDEIGAADVLCQPWDFSVRLALSFQKPYILKAECTLLDAAANFQQMSENFMAAGWEGFLDITINQQNNPYGAFLQAQEELEVRVGEEQERQQIDFSLGRGFLSITQPGECIESYGPGDLREGTCKTWAPDRVVTPSSLIADTVSRTNLSPLYQAELTRDLTDASSIIIGEVILQLINPNRGLADFDTQPLDAQSDSFSASLGDTLTERILRKISDFSDFLAKKTETSSFIQTVLYPIYDDLIGITYGAESAIPQDISGNGSCLAEHLATAGDTGSFDSVLIEISPRLREIVNLNQIDEQILILTENVPIFISQFQGYLDEIQDGSADLSEITDIVFSFNYALYSPTTAASERTDLDSQRVAAQGYLDACRATLGI